MAMNFGKPPIQRAGLPSMQRPKPGMQGPARQGAQAQLPQMPRAMSNPLAQQQQPQQQQQQMPMQLPGVPKQQMPVGGLRSGVGGLQKPASPQYNMLPGMGGMPPRNQASNFGTPPGTLPPPPPSGYTPPRQLPGNTPPPTGGQDARDSLGKEPEKGTDEWIEWYNKRARDQFDSGQQPPPAGNSNPNGSSWTWSSGDGTNPDDHMTDAGGAYHTPQELAAGLDKDPNYDPTATAMTASGGYAPETGAAQAAQANTPPGMGFAGWNADGTPRYEEARTHSGGLVDVESRNNPTATTGAGEGDGESSIFDDMMKTQDENWAETEKLINASAANQGRRNANINAAMGRSVGGGFGAATAQTSLGLADTLSKAKLQDNATRLDLMDRERQREHETDTLAAGLDPVPDNYENLLDDKINSLTGDDKIEAEKWEADYKAKNPKATSKQIWDAFEAAKLGNEYDKGGKSYADWDSFWENWEEILSMMFLGKDYTIAELKGKYEHWINKGVSNTSTDANKEFGRHLTSTEMARVKTYLWNYLQENGPNADEPGTLDILAALGITAESGE